MLQVDSGMLWWFQIFMGIFMFFPINLQSFWSHQCNILYIEVIIMMNCFCGIADQRKALSIILSRDSCQKSSTSRISDTPQSGFKSAQNLSSRFVEWGLLKIAVHTKWKNCCWEKHVRLQQHYWLVQGKFSLSKYK